MKLLRLWEHFRKLEPGLNEPTADLRSIQILQAGKFSNTNVGDVEFSDSDLDAIAANYNAGEHDAPLTLDHARQGPAYGWVKRGTVKREGSALFADFEAVPLSMVEAIKNKRYAKRSAEILKYSEPAKSLRAVTFLGAAPPVIKGMREVTLGSEDSSAFVDWAAATACFADDTGTFAEIDDEQIQSITAPKNSTTPAAGTSPQSEEIAMAETKEIKPETEPAKPAEVVNLAEIQSQIDSLKTENARLRADNATMQRERAEDKATALFSETWQRALVQGRVTVGEREAAEKFYNTLPLAEKDGVVCFGEDAFATKRAYLDTILARPAVHDKLTKIVTLSEDGKEEYAKAKAPVDDGDFRARRSELAKKKVAEAKSKGQTLELAEAIIEAGRELQNGTAHL